MFHEFPGDITPSTQYCLPVDIELKIKKKNNLVYKKREKKKTIKLTNMSSKRYRYCFIFFFNSMGCINDQLIDLIKNPMNVPFQHSHTLRHHFFFFFELFGYGFCFCVWVVATAHIYRTWTIGFKQEKEVRCGAKYS